MSEIHADLSQYYPIKSLFERILGKSSFKNVKDGAQLSIWKKESQKLIKAIKISIDATVEISDQEWKREINDLLQVGSERIMSVKSIDELHASLAATLGELAFLQIGFVPRGHINVECVPLITKNWRLDCVRTVQYVQSTNQRKLQVSLLKKKRNNGKT
jgi:hypothetical protein